MTLNLNNIRNAVDLKINKNGNPVSLNGNTGTRNTIPESIFSNKNSNGTEKGILSIDDIGFSNRTPQNGNIYYKPSDKVLSVEGSQIFGDPNFNKKTTQNENIFFKYSDKTLPGEEASKEFNDLGFYKKPKEGNIFLKPSDRVVPEDEEIGKTEEEKEAEEETKTDGEGFKFYKRETKTETRDDGAIVETTTVPRGSLCDHHSTIEKITYPDGRVEEREVFEDGTVMHEKITDAPDEEGTVHSVYKSNQGTSSEEIESWEHADGSKESITKIDGETSRKDKSYIDAEGNKIKEVEFADGSTVKEKEKPDGTVERIETDANGNQKKTVFNPNDNSEI